MREEISIKVAPTEALDHLIRNSIIELCIAAHQEEDFKNLFTCTPSGGRHFLGYLGQTLVSHAVVTTRWLYLSDQQRLKTAYVDAVATHPDHQGQRFGSATMQSLAQNIDDYDIVCLETERLSFYARLGWEAWQGELAYRDKNGLTPTPDQTGIMILRLPQTPSIDLNSLLAVEHDGRAW